jgi:centriolar protein POC1
MKRDTAAAKKAENQQRVKN